MKFTQKIGLLPAIALVVGGVIGMGAFVLMPGIVHNAGSKTWLALLLAIVFSLVSVFPIVQMASAMPTAGCGFVYASRLLNLRWGIVCSWISVAGGASAVALVAFGMAQSFATSLQIQASLHLLAALLCAVFYFFYRLGLRLLAAVQVLMSLQMLLALGLIASLLFSSNISAATSPLPSENFLLGFILSCNLCIGFQIVLELGEELKHPARNIPLALVIGAVVIYSVYLLVALAYCKVAGAVGVAAKTPLLSATAPYYPTAVNWFIQLGVLTASLTSFNGAAIALPREIFAMAREGVLHKRFSELNKDESPHHAVLLFFGLVIGILLVGWLLEVTGVLYYFFKGESIEFYGFLTIAGIMLMTILLNISAWRLPLLLPAEFQSAYFRLPVTALRLLIILSVLFATFMLVLVSTKIIVPLLYLLLVILVYQHSSTANRIP